MTRSALLLWLVVSVTGCAAAPGMHMQNRPVAAGAFGSDAAADGISIIPITAELLVEQKARQPPVSLPMAGDEPGPYRVGPRDILTITVWDHPELTIPAGEFRSPEAAGHTVGEDGTLFYPYVGVMKVAGKTVPEVRDALTQRLSAYIESPQLDVRVAAYRSARVYVVGEVNTPSIQPITDIPLTIAEAINLSGGATANANLRRVTLSRDGEVIPIDLQELYSNGGTGHNLLLRHGDVLNVPDLNDSKVFVFGEVGRPSSVVMGRGRMTLAEALGEAGGVSQATANSGRIYVIRNGGEDAEPEIYHLNARSADALLLADRFELEPRDVVYVDAAGITRWNRFASQVLPTALILGAGAEVAR